MPLTISHPIAVIPLWYLARRWLDLPALIVGAGIPDLTYFLHLQPVGNIGHSAWGVLVEGVPAGLLLLAVYAWLMRPALCALAPGSLGRLMQRPYSMLGLGRLGGIIVSIAIGAGSHILWDSFTHQGAYFVELWPALQAEIAGAPVFKLLQYGSGVFGLLGLVAIAAWAVRRARPYPGPRLGPVAAKLAWAVIFATVLVTTLAAFAVVPELTPKGVLVQSVVGFIAGGWLGTLVYALAFRLGLFAIEPAMP